MRNSGFTIIELLIASALMAVVMVFTMQIFTVNNQAYIKVDSVVDTQQSLRAVSSIIERDLRHAGMMVPEGAAVCGLDSDSAPDLLYISDHTAINPATAIGVFDGARITTVGNKFTGTPTLTLDSLVIEPDTPDPSYDTDGNGVNDSDFLKPGGGVIIVDLMDLGRGSECGIVTDVDLATNSIDVDIKTLGLDGNPILGAYELTAVPAIEYRVDNNKLYRNGLLLADGIEDLQIVYFLDANGNNAVDGGELRGDGVSADYVASLNDASALRFIRLNVVARTRSTDDNFTQGSFQATENRGTVAGQDGFRRRVHTAIVRMRNVGDRVESL